MAVPVERAVTGRVLYESTAQVAVNFGAADAMNPWKPWSDLTWDEQDTWEAQADELNESRRPL